MTIYGIIKCLKLIVQCFILLLQVSVLSNRKSKYHISIYTPYVFILVLAIPLVGLSLVRMLHVNNSLASVVELERTHKSCLKNIHNFMKASDLLTTQMWQYVSTQKRSHMDQYWEEVNVTRTRDVSLRELLELNINPQERAAAIAAKNESDSLINGERWAMRMTAEGAGMPISEMPKEVASVQLMPTDAALTPAEKIRKSIEYAFGEEYNRQKQQIVTQVDDFNYGINKDFTESSLSKLNEFQRGMRIMGYTQFIMLILLLLGFISFLFLILIPVLRYLRVINKLDGAADIQLTPSGSREMYHFARVLNKMYRQLLHRNRELAMLSRMDYLTRIPNRATITEYLEAELKKGTNNIGILMIDIDSFKSFNDNYGHMIGDRVLVILAEYLAILVPEKESLVGRLCGAEFVFIMPNTSSSTLDALACRILREVPTLNFNNKIVGHVKDNITVSIGSCIVNSGDELTFAQSIHRANKALYHSKGKGKNCHTSYESIYGKH